MLEPGESNSLPILLSIMLSYFLAFVPTCSLVWVAKTVLCFVLFFIRFYDNLRWGMKMVALLGCYMYGAINN